MNKLYEQFLAGVIISERKDAVGEETAWLSPSGKLITTGGDHYVVLFLYPWKYDIPENVYKNFIGLSYQDVRAGKWQGKSIEDSKGLEDLVEYQYKQGWATISMFSRGDQFRFFIRILNAYRSSVKNKLYKQLLKYFSEADLAKADLYDPYKAKPTSFMESISEAVKPRKSTVLVDFDGVIHSYTSEFTKPWEILDPPIKGAKEAIADLRKDYRVMVFSTRGLSKLGVKAMRKWLTDNGIKVDGFTAKKIPAAAYIDDNAVAFRSWRTALKQTKKVVQK